MRYTTINFLVKYSYEPSEMTAFYNIYIYVK